MKAIRKIIIALLLLIGLEGFGQSAGPNQIICLNSTVRMAASGIGSWSGLTSNPAVATIDTPSSATTTISNLSMSGIYGFVWGASAGDTMYVTVTPNDTLNITATANTLCFGLPDTFTIAYNNSTYAHSFNWYNRGSLISGITDSVYYTSNLYNLDFVYANVVNSLSCAAPVNNIVHLTVHYPPSAPLLTALGTCIGSDSLQVSGGGSATQYNWYLNGSSVFSLTNYQPYTVAGGNGQGIAANQLTPSAVFIDGSGNMYVADAYNNRVQKFPPGSTSATNGVTVAGGNGQGTAANQFWTPSAIYVDAGGNLYVADANNNGRVQKFPPGSNSTTNGVTVAGGNGWGNAANQISLPDGLSMDSSGYLYVSDGGYPNERVQKFPPGSSSATNSVIVAGDSGAVTPLSTPWSIFIDRNGYLYVADDNDRILKYPPGAAPADTAVIVAGGFGGNNAYSFNEPNGVVVDGDGYIYVSDLNNNRIQKFPPGSHSGTSAVTVAGGNGPGGAANQLNSPGGLFLDANRNIYVVDRGNNRIQKWPNSNLDSFYTPTAPGSYTATYVGSYGCVSLPSNVVAVNSCAPDTVWPGDADNNKIVDNADLLTIGLGYDSTGPVRTVTGVVWQADLATDWGHYFTIYLPTVNFVHADCNGDGIINADDTFAIVQNFGLTHAKTNGNNTPWRTGVPALKAVLSADTLYAGDTLTVTFVLGDTLIPANNIYGLAFTYNFDMTVVDSNYTTMTIGNSWLGNNTDKISINKILNTAGQIKAALTRIDHASRSGNGPIAVATFKITTDNISGKDFMYYSNHGFISDITGIDQHGNPITLNSAADSNLIGYTPNAIKEIPQEKISLYPNPSHDRVTISADNIINDIVVTDVTGREIIHQTNVSRRSAAIEVSACEDGLYTVRVKTAKGAGIVKLIVAK